MKIHSIFFAAGLTAAFTSDLSAQVVVVNKVASGIPSSSASSQSSFTCVPVNPGNTLVFTTYVDNSVTGTAVTLDGGAAQGFIRNGRSTPAYIRIPPSSCS